MSTTRRHLNRKRTRLVQKLQAMHTNLLIIKAAPKGAGIPGNVDFDPEALYMSRTTLLELLKLQEDVWVEVKDKDIVKELP